MVTFGYLALKPSMTGALRVSLYQERMDSVPVRLLSAAMALAPTASTIVRASSRARIFFTKQTSFCRSGEFVKPII